MTPVAIYLAKLFLCSGILYGYYHIALRNNKFHHWNRFYLIGITVLSIILPLINIPITGKSEQSQLLYYTANMFTATGTPTIHPAPSAINLSSILLAIYIIVAFILLTRLIFSLSKLLRLVKRSKIFDIPPYHLVENEIIRTPFSFFSYIFWDTTPIDSLKGQQILRHELVHIQEKHSSDKLFMEIITSIGWLNPFFFLIKRELILIHEFLADKKAAGKEVGSYAETILQAAFQTNQFKITNNFFQSPIKRRILMLTRFHHPRFSYMRRILVLPLSAFIFCSLAFVVDNRSTHQEPTIEISTPVSTPAPVRTAIAAPAPIKTSKPYQEEVHTKVDELPTFKGGETALMNYLSKNVRYPREAQEKNQQGTVFIQFNVGKDGSLSNIKSTGNNPSTSLTAEAIRVIKAMPNWEPAKIKHQPVLAQMTLPIRFTLQEDSSPAKEKHNELFTIVTNPPQYPGGEAALAKFLSKHIKFPKAAQDAKVSATVFIDFIIDTEGNISDVKPTGVVKGYGLEEEAIRVIKEMPKWIPGKQNDRVVNVAYSLPIRFNAVL
ncbi:M56 family peptidase [Chitinophaga silvatica]|uniref:M56 family peptidase n=1 Tax=Chitinophaga silvatica TaxID=2282649 RepID=A0A3E1Y553_9BACT|nr:M56 family metallopeptidase [Chitinophaga silvatica]RFS19766.1 M56 family peptidase [Chitinophaga silvatica]